MISVIIPAFNAHSTIKRTLASIAMQENISDIETIIVDDCSSKSYDEVAKLFQHMMTIKVVKMLKNGGPGAARQVGLDHCKGDFVTFIDADDTFMGANSLVLLEKIMNEKNMDCVYGQFLEESDQHTISLVHEAHMVWVFGKLYRKSFLDQFNIRFNTSLSNEDTGFNCLVKGCTTRVWYEKIPVYIWHYKPNSITRINGGMYGFDSGYKGYIDNMVWQLLELNKRFVNKNFIMTEAISIMITLYYFHIENLKKYPMGVDASMNWIRGYYAKIYKGFENHIDSALFDQVFLRVQSEQSCAKTAIPTMTIYEFMDEVRRVPYDDTSLEYQSGGATPAGYIPIITPMDWPTEEKEYAYNGEIETGDSCTSLQRMDGMKKMAERDMPKYENIKEKIPETEDYKKAMKELNESDKDYHEAHSNPEDYKNNHLYASEVSGNLPDDIQPVTSFPREASNKAITITGNGVHYDNIDDKEFFSRSIDAKQGPFTTPYIPEKGSTGVPLSTCSPSTTGDPLCDDRGSSECDTTCSRDKKKKKK